MVLVISHGKLTEIIHGQIWEGRELGNSEIRENEGRREEARHTFG